MRNIKVDAFKGLLIMCVVAGHLFNGVFFNWFHMPLFFLLGGYLFPLDFNNINLGVWIRKKIKRLIIPYIAYWILISILTQTYFNKTSIINFVVGGRRLYSQFGVFWFPLCLFISQLLFVLIKKTHYDKLIILFMYFAAILLSNIINLKYENIIFYIPWCLDVCLLSTSYLFIGNEIKRFELINNIKIINKLNVFYFFFGISVVIAMLYLYFLNIYKYEFNMKYCDFRNIILPIFIPVIFGIIILFFVKFVGEKIDFYLSVIGRSSMVIMYTHNLVFYYFNMFNETPKYLLFVYAIIIGCLLYFCFSKNKYLSILFLGEKYNKIIR